jgi:hypothetical protein
MADFSLGILSHVLNCTFLSGFVGGISIAWLLFKTRSKILAKNAAFSPENSSTCGEVSWIRRLYFSGENVLCLEVTVIIN